MRSGVKTILVALISAAFVGMQPAMAEVKLQPIFGDHMVLQQGIPVPFWGQADPGEKVTVKVQGKEAEATADQQGAWSLKVGPLKSGGPLQVTIAGENSITFSDVLVGEVWVCSGQSNMAMQTSRANDPDKESAAADYPKIRLFKVASTIAEEPRNDLEGSWTLCSPQTVPGFSAVGYFFGRELHKASGVPVGLIQSAWGGTPAESWTSRKAIEAVEELRNMQQEHQQRAAAAAKVAAKAASKPAAKPAKPKAGAQAAGAPLAQPTADQGAKPAPKPAAAAKPSRASGNPQAPFVLFNGMINPLVPYGIAGAIWYQGESNAPRAEQSRTLLPTMIKDWRTRWGQEFPFLIVQLANFKPRAEQPGDSDWAELREAQTLTTKLPKVAQAVIIDVGDAADIHPKNKQEVGRRLALAAQHVAYGRKLEWSGPVFDAMKVDGDKVRLSFAHADGLKTADGGPLTGFAIAGAGRKFVWAKAEIDGPAVVLKADGLSEPVAVRYAWADNPACNLVNGAGLPAVPFRTDDWPLKTAGKR